MKKLLATLMLILCLVTFTQVDMLAKTRTAVRKASAATTSSKVYMSLWGTIGSQSAEFDMSGTKGWYYLDNREKDKRTLVLKSYNKRTGRVILKAYYKGKFIGTFDGIFEEFNHPEHYGQSYSGKFKSVNGTVLDFYLYFD